MKFFSQTIQSCQADKNGFSQQNEVIFCSMKFCTTKAFDSFVANIINIAKFVLFFISYNYIIFDVLFGGRLVTFPQGFKFLS